MGKRHRRAHLSSYRLLIAHLLKWQFQPERRSRSWFDTIDRERFMIVKRETDGNGFERMANEAMDTTYDYARKDAADETGRPLANFPAECPYTVEQLRDRDFLPE